MTRSYALISLFVLWLQNLNTASNKAELRLTKPVWAQSLLLATRWFLVKRKNERLFPLCSPRPIDEERGGGGTNLLFTFSWEILRTFLWGKCGVKMGSRYQKLNRCGADKETKGRQGFNFLDSFCDDFLLIPIMFSSSNATDIFNKEGLIYLEISPPTDCGSNCFRLKKLNKNPKSGLDRS